MSASNCVRRTMQDQVDRSFGDRLTDANTLGIGSSHCSDLAKGEIELDVDVTPTNRQVQVFRFRRCFARLRQSRSRFQR